MIQTPPEAHRVAQVRASLPSLQPLRKVSGGLACLWGLAKCTQSRRKDAAVAQALESFEFRISNLFFISYFLFLI
jgi:hypothetical protein